MQRSWGERFIAVISLICFTAYSIVGSVFAAPVHLPSPKEILSSSQSYTPVLLKGLTIDPKDPLAFHFIADAAETGLIGEALQQDTTKLITYFVTSLAIPESDMWVNLSPLEKDRIIPEAFGKTEMGRDLLMQDYVLKQVTAGFLNPQNEVGRKFWDKVYESADSTDHSVQEAVESFNKVWIIPDQADIYQHGNSVFIVQARLKVMMEEDYEAHAAASSSKVNDSAAVVKDAFRQIIVPAIEQEVNEGQNFALLRQVYNAMLLAIWYKKALKESVLGTLFADHQNIRGIDLVGRGEIESVYNQYVQTFESGASSVIEERYDPVSGQIVPQMYFSGGALAYKQSQLNVTNRKVPHFSDNVFHVSVDFAQMSEDPNYKPFAEFEEDEERSGNNVMLDANKGQVTVEVSGTGKVFSFETNGGSVDLDSIQQDQGYNTGSGNSRAMLMVDSAQTSADPRLPDPLHGYITDQELEANSFQPVNGSPRVLETPDGKYTITLGDNWGGQHEVHEIQVQPYNSENSGRKADKASLNGGIDLKYASDLVNIAQGEMMTFPRMADFSEVEFNFENVSLDIGVVSPMPRTELNRLLGL